MANDEKSQNASRSTEANVPPRGTSVILHGLTTKSELNGRTGKVLGQTKILEAQGRVAVLLDRLEGDASSCMQQISVATRNLQVVGEGASESCEDDVFQKSLDMLENTIRQLIEHTRTYRTVFQRQWRAGGRGQGGGVISEHIANSWQKMDRSLRHEAIDNAVGAAAQEAGSRMSDQIRKILVELQVEDHFLDEAAPLLKLLIAVDEGTEENSYVRDVVTESGRFPFKIDALEGLQSEREHLLRYYDVVYSLGVSLFAQKIADGILDIYPLDIEPKAGELD